MDGYGFGSIFIWLLVLFIAIWLLSEGAEGAMNNPSFFRALFALIIFFVGLALLSKALGFGTIV